MTLTTPSESLSKRCTECGVTKDVSQFFKRSPGPGWRHRCKSCYAAKARTYKHAATHPQPRYQTDAKRRGVQRWMKANRERMRIAKNAGQRVMRAIRKGLLVRPETCGQCGSTGRIQAAHTDYSRPFDVRWLCQPCHTKWDHADPKTVVAA